MLRFGLVEAPVAELDPAVTRTGTVSPLDIEVQKQKVQALYEDWKDSPADATREKLERAVDDLKREKLIRAFGISVNRWEPSNILKALETGLVDSVQVVYNDFDQNPEDELFPACRARGVAVIARVPFDEGSLTGTLTADARWPEGDFRNVYFQPENLRNTLDRVERLRPDLPDGMSMPETALRFILENRAVSTVIPGMRKLRHVESNLAVSRGRRLTAGEMQRLRRHRWDRWIDLP
jgi:aryl-alcohol dehydrogenase-like predicted oxidoreductase